MAESNHTSLNSLVLPGTRYVLALPGWYPTWIDPLPGDFNQRHIIAASQHVPQLVLYIGKDHTGTLATTEVRFNQVSPVMAEVLVVYPQPSIKAMDAVLSNLNFLHYLNKYAALIQQRFGRPMLLHSYIVMKGGLAGLILSKRWKRSFVLTENWTIYYPTDPGHLARRNVVFKWIVQKVFANLSWFLPVTYNLYSKVEAVLQKVPFSVVPNVVDTNAFYYFDRPPRQYFQFVHVSTMIYQKNPEGLLRAFSRLNQQNSRVHLLMVGPYEPQVKACALSLGLTENAVSFTGAVSYNKVAEHLYSSDALVLFSRYENLPCVILEAFCTGIPVISTSVGGIAEVIDKNNGLLVESEAEGQLLNAMTDLIKTYSSYDGKKIAANALQRFSYQAVGSQINQVYDKVLNMQQAK